MQYRNRLDFRYFLKSGLRSGIERELLSLTAAGNQTWHIFSRQEIRQTSRIN